MHTTRLKRSYLVVCTYDIFVLPQYMTNLLPVEKVNEMAQLSCTMSRVEPGPQEV